MTESPPKINLISLGCAKNLIDSEIILSGLMRDGISLTDEPEEAHTVIINTCGFLDIAREESIDYILRVAELKKKGTLHQLIVMGCLSERYPQELKQEIPEVDHFFGTNNHRQIISLLTGNPYSKDDPLLRSSLLTPPHYAYLKIAEGCDNECTFCSIPLMRGLQKSRSIAEIMAEAERLVDSGVKELIIIAQDTTSYGWDLAEKTYLDELIRELNTLSGRLGWIRIHYAHPAHLSRKIIRSLAESDKMCRYLDIPIQHASDRILESMQRGLGQAGIRNRINQLRAAIPEIRLRTSLIVGYPGESENDFQELCDFIREIQFDRLGIFTYSEEEGTPAAQLKDDVPRSAKDERKALIQEIQNDISAGKNAGLTGSTLKVLVDEVKDGKGIGRTEFDSPEIDNLVYIEGKVTAGEFVNVRIDDSNEFELFGTLIL